MRPQKNISRDVMKTKPQTINVGYRGTSPVLRYSMNTGMNRTTESNNKMKLMKLKKDKGR